MAGKVEGMAEAVLRVLRGRFGEPDDRPRAARICAADATALDGVLDRALTAERHMDVLDACDRA